MKRLMAVLLLFASGAAFSQDKTSVVSQRLASTNVFAFGGIGFAGVRSEGEKDFLTIMSLPPATAISAFETLYNTGNTQAKSYALAGLRSLDVGKFKALLNSTQSSDLKVNTETGCIVSSRPLRIIATAIESGYYDPEMAHASPLKSTSSE